MKRKQARLFFKASYCHVILSDDLAPFVIFHHIQNPMQISQCTLFDGFMMPPDVIVSRAQGRGFRFDPKQSSPSLIANLASLRVLVVW